MPANAVLVNFSSGETSPKSRGRFDAPWYSTSARKIVNWITELMGAARFRSAFRFARETRRGNVARLIQFQLSNSAAYQLEFTDGYMRVYKNEDLLTTAVTTISAMTQADPGVLTVVDPTSLSDGDTVIITGALGMWEINNSQFVLAAKSGSTFQLTDPITGDAIDTSGWGALTSGGTVNKVVEVVAPYAEADLAGIQNASNGALGVMYLTHPNYEPRKITVDSSDNFTLATFSRTSDPFVAGAAISLVSTASYGVMRSLHTGDAFSGTVYCSGPVRAGSTVVLFPAGTTIIPGAIYTFAAVVGTTQINGGSYTLIPFVYGDATQAEVLPTLAIQPTLVMAVLRTTTGGEVDSLSWTAYSSGGTATPAKENPIAVGFYEGRLGYYGTNRRPACFFLSRGPDSSGNARYDDFTGGSNADDACFFQLAPAAGSSDYISWAQGGPDHLFIGTFGGPFRVSGSGLDTPITPSSVNVRQFDTAGCEAAMAAGCQQLFFIQRGGTTVRAVKILNPYLATFETVDLCKNADQIPYSALQRATLQQGRPYILWVTRADGILAGMSVDVSPEQQGAVLTGWHRHKLGGEDAKVLDVSITQRTTGLDLLWIVSERLIDGVTKRFVEIQADEVSFPDPEDFFSGDQAADEEKFNNAVYRAQENYIHVDAATTYDGSQRGYDVDATLTPSAISGTAITLTASQLVFRSTDVGEEIWRKPDLVTGEGGGRAVITAFTDSTHVTAEVLVEFDSLSAIPAGDWYFAVTTLYGLRHLEGESVAIVTDGAVLTDGGQTGDEDFETYTVTDGKITLPDAAAVVHVGLPYIGILESHNLEMGGRTGPAQDKPRTIAQMYIRFMNSLGVEYGTDPYKMTSIDHRLSNATFDRPAPVFSGPRRLVYEDTTSGVDDGPTEKRVILMQRLPLPAIVESIDLHFDAADEG